MFFSAEVKKKIEANETKWFLAVIAFPSTVDVDYSTFALNNTNLSGNNGNYLSNARNHVVFLM